MNTPAPALPEPRARMGRHMPVLAAVAAFVANLLAPCDASAQSMIVRSGDPRIEATNTVVRAFDNPMEMGFSVQWYSFQGDQLIGGLKVGLWDIVAKRVRPEIVNYFATHYLNATFRYPGGNQNDFIWTDTIGPMAQRPLHTSATGQMQVEFGFDEFMDFVEVIQGKAMIGVNMVGMTAQDAANWVSYANATTGYWAELRAANGHPAPYNIRVWELGNELDTAPNSPFKGDPDAYVASCREYIAAMRAVDPTIQFQAHVRSAPWKPENNAGWRNWHQTVLQGLGTDIAALVFHPYYDGTAIKTIKSSYISVIAADAAALVPVNTPKIYNTEHAMWKDDNDDNWATSSITGAKASADFLIMTANHAAVSGNCWHVLGGDGGWWRPFEYDAASNVYYAPRPSTDAMQVLSRHLRGKETLATTVYTPNDAGYWGGYDVRAAVLRDATGQLAVAAVNRGAGVNCVMALPGLSGTVAGRYEIVQGTAGVEIVNTTFAIASDGTFNAYLYPGASVLQLSTTPATAYGAENAVNASVTIQSTNAGFNGTGYGNFPPNGGKLTFKQVDGGAGGTKIIAFRYALGDTVSRTGELVVNGVTSSITFAPSGAWTAWMNHSMPVALKSGATNTIELKSIGQDLANVDELTVHAAYGAEDAVNASVTIQSTNTGFNGTGYGNFPPNGGKLTFKLVDGGAGGTKIIAFRYALGDAVSRTGELVVNGVTSSITFAPTGAWTTWMNHSLPVTLKSGASNTIELKSTGADLANVDELTGP